VPLAARGHTDAFDALVSDVMSVEPYASAHRVFATSTSSRLDQRGRLTPAA